MAKVEGEVINLIDTKFGIYGESNLEHLNEVFKKYLPEKSFIDLGSGRGLVVNYAENWTNKNFGIDIEEKFKGDNAMDYFDKDLGEFDVLYYYLFGTDDELKLIRKLEKECKEGAIIIFYDWQCETVKRDHFYSMIKDLEYIESFDNVRVYKK